MFHSSVKLVFCVSLFAIIWLIPSAAVAQEIVVTATEMTDDEGFGGKSNAK